MTATLEHPSPDVEIYFGTRAVDFQNRHLVLRALGVKRHCSVGSYVVALNELVSVGRLEDRW
jgi:hypothetical protein